MANTYALIGSRADLGGLLAEAQLKKILPSATRGWGVGFFEKDEVLLRRDPHGTDDALTSQVRNARSHAFLACACPFDATNRGPDGTPPLRYGHVLFACQGADSPPLALIDAASKTLPDSLRRTVRGQTMTEVAFALFLSELPAPSLARTRLREPRRSVDPLQEGSIKKALRNSLKKLDALCSEQDSPPFQGSLWVHTGEILVVAHRKGNFCLQVIRGSMDLGRWDLALTRAPTGVEQSVFVSVAAPAEELDHSWERLPNDILLTAPRGEAPRTESL